MSSTVSRPADALPAAPTFSYAQAAKGRAASSTTSAIQSSQATSGVNSPAKESISATQTPSVSVNGAAGSDAGDRIVNGNAVNKADPLGLGINVETKSKSLTISGSLPDSPSFGTASTSTLPKEEEVTLAANGLEGNWRNHPPPSGTAKASETHEGRRNKKGKKQRSAETEAEKEKEEVKPEVLVAAPPPSVNIWQQRREAAAAKVQPSSSISQSPKSFDAPSTNEAADGQSTRPVDIKRRGKPGEEAEKLQGATQNGSSKDVLGATKGQKKGADATTKAKDEATKRAGPRGSRGAEKDEKPQTNQLPPPVEDAISWPTPETALEEEKRKVQDKPEKEVKDDSAPNKSRPKEKWMPVPFVPSVNFATPIPTRGGRGRGGGRGGRDSNGRGSHSSNGGALEKATQTATSTPGAAGDVESREGGNSDVGRAASLPPSSSKRPTSDARERKLPATSSAEKSRTQASTSAQEDLSSALISQAEQAEVQQGVRGDTFKKPDQIQGPLSESIYKPSTGDRRDSLIRGSDQFKEGGNFSKDNGQTRERDGQLNRGRGGFRGRGNNHNYPNTQNPQQAFANGHAAQPTNGFPLRHNSNPYSSPLQQTPFPNQFVPNPSRSGRGGSRSQSIPNTAMFPRFPMQPLQTNQSMFDYQNMPMSASPYNPFNMESFNVLAMVTMQLEYYFSIDNLCKDVFLRKHMDSQGFVFLAFIAGFKRIQALTQDFELLRYACQESRIIDAIQGEDGVDRLRRQEGWEKWVLPTMEERDESVRHAGPKYHHRPQPRPQHMGQGNQTMSPPPFSPNGTEAGFPLYLNEVPIAPALNGSNHHSETLLSAAVPDFAPGVPHLNGLSNSLEGENFSDEEVAALMIVVTSSKSSAPVHGPSSRTFSNGSIDGTQITEDSHDNHRQGRTLTNGTRASETSPDNLRRSRSPFAPLSPTSMAMGNAPTVMWVKGKSLSQANGAAEKYTDVRARALGSREASTAADTHHDMKVLYEFWAHFLVRNFNHNMYAEFRTYALEDAQRNASVGLEQLSRYYDQVLSKPKVISDTLAAHYIELVKNEKASAEANSHTPAFARLRASWRNGALDMKSRKKIDSLVGAELKQELER
ncbi:putative HTH La-type RNA-binding [Hyphodiscus hymeniophilus]|uniref:HTH La-type RNA-binding n=1 Tax=Hyphodiscus hymeniophilus TaxID=353542 RepID=A0A9P7AY79_9HELO|nr:putative HTH La-type RNA-binding [Hyphodiscus hymeniophilus]